MNAGRTATRWAGLACALYLTLTAFGAEPLTLFSDSFDRADGADIDASLDGIVNNTGSAMAAGVWNEVHGAGLTHVADNQLWLAHGFGTSNACIAHNFTNSSILDAGEFSVAVDVTALTQTKFVPHVLVVPATAGTEIGQGRVLQ